MRSYPSRTSGPAVFRTPSLVAFQRRLRARPLRTTTAATAPAGLRWSVDVDWDGDGYGAADDVTDRVLSRASVQAEYGRDQARALLPMTSGRASAELDNQDRELSPDNTASSLHGRILPGRPWRVQGHLQGTTYTVFGGHLDSYTLRSRIEDRSVQITGLDAVARMKGIKASTPLYQGIRTGDAIGYVLDAIGFTGPRDIDPGATLIRWWWIDGEDAFQAITDLVESEGPPAFFHADADGGVVFRDRHHRLLAAASTTAQAEFEPGTDLKFEDFSLELGWSDIVNSVAIKVDEWDPDPVADMVWQSTDIYTIPAGTTLEVAMHFEDPTQNPTLDEEVLAVLAGSVTATLTADTARHAVLELTAGGVDAQVTDILVQGQPLQVARSYEVAAEDATSINLYGARDPMQLRAKWAGVHDAAAIADLVLGARAERLPLVTITLLSGTQEENDVARLQQQLGRDLSDRVHIREDGSGVDYDFFLERIKHRISQGGMLLETEFTLEKAAVQAADVFRFDDADHGFDEGVFGASGLDDPDSIFLFDTAGRGFNDGVFAT